MIQDRATELQILTRMHSTFLSGLLHPIPSALFVSFSPPLSPFGLESLPGETMLFGASE